MQLNFLEINELLGKKLQSGEPFSCLRIDNTAGFIMDTIFKGSDNFHGFFTENTLIEGGVHPATIEHGYKIYENTLKIMQQSDILGFVDISGEISRSTFLEQFGEKPIFAGGQNFYIMDPGAILGHSFMGPVETPWTQYLKGKRVLVISTHKESILHQWKRKELIWGETLEKIAPFELVDVIRSPYHPLLDNRQYPNCHIWEDSVNYIKNLMDLYDYDVLLTGATTSSPFFAEHAKQSGKVGIQTGGVIQLYFGVLGYRWAKVSGHSGWHNMFNQYWMYPLPEDRPQKTIQQLESFYAYW